jgi:hypothetical protein
MCGNLAISAEPTIQDSCSKFRRENTMVRFIFQHSTIQQPFRRFTCLILAGLLTVGSPLMAGEPAAIGVAPEARSSDVALSDGGLLRGTVLNTEAQPVPGVEVNVLHNQKVVAKTLSNEKGEFTIKGLHNGAHVIHAGNTNQIVRFWGTAAAPPAAVENLAVIVDEEAVRGQSGGGVVGGFIGSNLGGLLLIGGATAVTLGTTLGDQNVNSGSSNAIIASP